MTDVTTMPDVTTTHRYYHRARHYTSRRNFRSIIGYMIDNSQVSSAFNTDIEQCAALSWANDENLQQSSRVRANLRLNRCFTHYYRWALYCSHLVILRRLVVINCRQHLSLCEQACFQVNQRLLVELVLLPYYDNTSRLPSNARRPYSLRPRQSYKVSNRLPV